MSGINCGVIFNLLPPMVQIIVTTGASLPDCLMQCPNSPSSVNHKKLGMNITLILSRMSQATNQLTKLVNGEADHAALFPEVHDATRKHRKRH